MWSLINIKETVNMQIWNLIIEIFINKSQGYLKQIYLVNKYRSLSLSLSLSSFPHMFTLF